MDVQALRLMTGAALSGSVFTIWLDREFEDKRMAHREDDQVLYHPHPAFWPTPQSNEVWDRQILPLGD